MESKWFAAVLIAAGIALLFCMLKRKHFFKTLFFSAVQGTAALFAVNLLTTFTGVSLAVNAVTLLFCGVGGIPGVVLLLGAKLLFR